MVCLNNFKKSTKDKKRFGRSGCFGGTSGRGHKGYKARSGSTVKGFEGGQTPIYRRLPMRGFNSNKEKKYSVISLKKIIAIGKGGNDNIDNEIFFNYGVIKDIKDDVKIIGSDVSIEDLKSVKKISASFASNGVKEFLKKNGVELVLKNS